MNVTEICEAVRDVKRRCGEEDPFRLVARMGICLIPAHLGTAEDCIKGFFLECRRIRTVTVNVDLSRALQRVVLAHELGHAVLHKDHGVHAFHELALFDGTARMEREANLFAAELLLRDREVLRVWEEADSFFSAAAQLGVPAELLEFKCRILREKGFRIPEAPIAAKSGFLKQVTTVQSGEWQ